MKLGWNRNKSEKLWLIEWAGMAGILLAIFLGSALEQEQAQLSSGMIRLHVVANSDSEADQNLKYVVRDEVLQLAEGIYQENMNPQEAESLFRQALSQFESRGEAVSLGYDVTAELCEMWFPTKEYSHFSLPAGDYTALKITIGAGEGENWWCVAYPPLCLGAATETIETTVEAGHFSPEERDLITGNGYVFKFKTMEILGNWKEFLRS